MELTNIEKNLLYYTNETLNKLMHCVPTWTHVWKEHKTIIALKGIQIHIRNHYDYVKWKWS